MTVPCVNLAVFGETDTAGKVQERGQGHLFLTQNISSLPCCQVPGFLGIQKYRCDEPRFYL